MSLPFANRAAVATIPEQSLKDLGRPLSSAIVIEDLATQFDDLKESFVCVQIQSRVKILITFTSSERMEDVVSTGLTFKHHPVVLEPVSYKRWVTITRLPYGFANESVALALSPFGEVYHVKMEMHQGIATGTRSVQMKIRHDIPSRIRIEGHNCNTFYRGQTRTCFRCGAQSHEAKACPRNALQTTPSPCPPAGHTPDTTRAPSTSSAREPTRVAAGPPGEPPAPVLDTRTYAQATSPKTGRTEALAVFGDRENEIDIPFDIRPPAPPRVDPTLLMPPPTDPKVATVPAKITVLPVDSSLVQDLFISTEDDTSDSASDMTDVEGLRPPKANNPDNTINLDSVRGYEKKKSGNYGPSPKGMRIARRGAKSSRRDSQTDNSDDLQTTLGVPLSNSFGVLRDENDSPPMVTESGNIADTPPPSSPRLPNPNPPGPHESDTPPSNV